MTQLSETHKNIASLGEKTPPAFYDSLLVELEAMRKSIDECRKAHNDIEAVSCALQLTLRLLDASEIRHLNGDEISCLLSPLHLKLSNSLSALDKAI